MQMIHVACPLCHGVFPVAEAAQSFEEAVVGKSLRCQKCGAPFTVSLSDLCNTPVEKNRSAAPNEQASASDAPWWVEHPPTAPAASTTQRPPSGILVQPGAKAAAPRATPAPPTRPEPVPAATGRTARTAPISSAVAPTANNRLIALIGVTVGGVLFLGVGVTLAIISLSSGRGTTPETVAAEDMPAPQVAEASPPPLVKKNVPLQQARPQPPPEEPRPKETPQPQPEQPPAKDVAKAEAPKPATAAAKPAIINKHGVTADQQKQIDAAIARGVQFLEGKQSQDGSWAGYSNYPLGPTALAALTLLECGVPNTDPRLVKAASVIRKGWVENAHTYELALSVLFLDRFGDKKDKRILQAIALRLIKGQDQNGGWGYECPIMSDAEATQLMTYLQKTRPKTPVLIDKTNKSNNPLPLDKGGDKNPLPNALDKGDKSGLQIPVDKKDKSPPLSQGSKGAQSPAEQLDPPEPDDTLLVAFMPPQQKGNQKGTKMPFKMAMPSDNSNTQFAMLGLWAARRHDVPVENILALCERRFRVSQMPSGAWTYRMGQGEMSATPSMTCVGLLGIALGQGSAAEVSMRGVKKDANDNRPVPSDEQARNGLRALHLEKHRDNPSLYMVWSVERIGVLYGLTKIGEHDWYQWGLNILLPSQNINGGWQTNSYHGSNALHDTCFALLFLKRVNLAQDLTDLNLFNAIIDPK
jgi:hypothetical protein